MTRIAIAGFQHETNSFSPVSADLAAFEIADSWPGLLSGDGVLPGTAGMNLPLAGFAKAAMQAGAQMVPLLWCAAEPSGPVTTAAFDTIAGRITDGLRAAGPIDGVYLDLHGAMITEEHDDGEGELLRRIRAVIGPDLPVVVSLDMHCHLTPEMLQHADRIAICRQYPHLDLAETGARCWPILAEWLDGGRPAMAFRPVPYVIPLHTQFTGAGPARRIADAAADATQIAGVTAELSMGFPSGDTAHTGASVLVYGPTETAANRVADTLLATILRAEPEFDRPAAPPRDVIAQARALPPGKPVVIADVQDNPGGGGSSDTTGLLRALVDLGEEDVLFGMMHDPAVAERAHALGVGAVFEAPLGGRSGLPDDKPFAGRYRVLALSDGHVAFEGEMYGGCTAQIGPTAAMALEEMGAGVTIVVSSLRTQCLDRAYFRHLGLTPESARLICVKSTVHYRADFEPIAQTCLPTAAPGLLTADMANQPFRRLRDGLRLGPCGASFSKAGAPVNTSPSGEAQQKS